MIYHITSLILMVISLSYFYWRIKRLEKDYLYDIKLKIKLLEEAIRINKHKVMDGKELYSRNKDLIQKNREITTSISNISRKNREMVEKNKK